MMFCIDLTIMYYCIDLRLHYYDVLPRHIPYRTIRTYLHLIISNKRRSCVGCLSTHSSGDWYRDQKNPSAFNCQKCYQRKNRDKLRKKSKIGFQSEDENEDYDTLDSPSLKSASSSSSNSSDTFTMLGSASQMLLDVDGFSKLDGIPNDGNLHVNHLDTKSFVNFENLLKVSAVCQEDNATVCQENAALMPIAA